jgi:hypothetical protein
MPRAGSTKRHRRFMGTLYFPTLEKRESWAEYINTDPFTRFFICQPEICPTPGKLLVQF